MTKSSTPDAAQLAAAAFDLWQQQWNLLRADSGSADALQKLLEQISSAMTQTIAAASMMKETPHAAKRPPSGQAKTTATAAASSQSGDLDLAKLALAVAQLDRRIERLEATLAAATPPPRRRAPRKNQTAAKA
jgi:hypothetical protein